MDGVLIDSEALTNHAAVTFFHSEGHLDVLPADFTQFVGSGEDSYLSGVASLHQIDLDLPLAKRRLSEIFLTNIEKLSSFAGAAELHEQCRSAGFRLAIATSSSRSRATMSLDHTGLRAPSWDAIITADDVNKPKPAPDLFLEAARQLGVPPNRCVVVEDSLHGLSAAEQAGMRCIAVTTSFPSKTLSAADAVATSIADIAAEDISRLVERA